MAGRRLSNQVWLLKGLIGSEAGTLELSKGRLTYTTHSGRLVFDAPLSKVSEVKFPWFYFGAGATLKVEGVRYRLSFIRPGNTAGGEYASTTAAREVADAWKAALEPNAAEE